MTGSIRSWKVTAYVWAGGSMVWGCTLFAMLISENLL